MSSDPTHSIPDEKFSGRNLSDVPAMLVLDGYEVCEWTSERDGKGDPEMVCLVMHLGAELDGTQIVLRIKSRAEANRLIEVLRRHRDGVWPLSKDEQ